ncbi:MAG: hypothetical protein QM758_07980 [Armatimonas sp.]
MFAIHLRFLYVHQPGLLALAEAQSRQLKSSIPLAISQGRIILDTNTAALQKGIAAGQLITQARRLCPLLLVVPVEELDQRSVRKLSRLLWNTLADLSPTVEPAGPNAAFATLLPSEEKLFQERLTGIFPDLPLPRIGIAQSKLCAQVFAESGATELSKVRVNSLLWPTDSKVIERLLRLGLTSFGMVDAIGEDALIYQFGRRIGPLLHRRAQGIDSDLIRPLWPPPQITTRQDFRLDPLEDRGCLEHWLAHLTGKAAGELAESGRHARCIHLQLSTETNRFSRTWQPPLPLQNPREIHRAFLRLLVQATINAPVTYMALTLSELELSASHSLALFETNSAEDLLRLEGAKRLVTERYGPKAAMILGAIPIPRRDRRYDHHIEQWGLAS